jgi:hypothetical protein
MIKGSGFSGLEVDVVNVTFVAVFDFFETTAESSKLST